MGAIGGTAAAAPAAGTGAGGTIVAHGVSTFGNLALPADFAHLSYVNPAAPKGGEISEWAPGGFDSYNPFSIKGRAAALSSTMLESLLTTPADEVGAAYCLLCETVEYPPGRDWAIFTLRKGITFSDGTPMTSADVLFSYEQLRDKGLSSFRAVIRQPATVRSDRPRSSRSCSRPRHTTVPKKPGVSPNIARAHCSGSASTPVASVNRSA